MGADGVEVPQQGHVQLRVRRAEVRQDALNKQLGSPVGIGGAAHGEILPDGNAGGVAVHRGGGRKDEVPHPVAAHDLKEGEGALQIIRVILQRFPDAFAHRLQSREVDHGGDARIRGKYRLQRGRVAGVRLVKRDCFPGDPFHPAEGLPAGVHQIVHRHDFISAL